jgi:integrase
MATFTYDISDYRRKDGTYQVRIRMIHNRTVIRKPTSVYVSKEQLSRDLSKIRDSYVLEVVNRQLDTLRKAEASIEGAEFYSCGDLWEAIAARLKQTQGFRLDLHEYAKGKMAAMEPKTAEGYRSSLNALRRFTKKEAIDINEITYPLLVDFRAFIEKESGKGCRAVSYYLSCLRHLHNLARAEFNDEDVGLIRIPRQPFKKGLIPPQPVTEHRTLTVEQVKAIMAYQPEGLRAAVAKDALLLSLCLIGMNTIDMYFAEKKDLKGGVITYNRAKTDSVRKDKALMKVRVEPEAKEIIDRHKGAVKLLDFADRYSTHKNFNQNVNKGLKEIGKALGIEKLTTLHARHTWATLARNACNFDFDTVHQGLNHASRGTDRITDIYVERDWSKVWEANRAVLDLFQNRQ